MKLPSFVSLDWIRRNIFWLVLAFLAALYIWPIWTVEFPPSCDLHAHLGIVALMRNITDPNHFQSQFFTWGAFPMPNILYYVTTYLLSFPFGLIVANQLVLSLYVVIFPLCMLFFLRAFGRDRWLVLLAMAFLWNRFSFYGFVDYIISIPLLFFALGLVYRYCERPTLKRFAFVTAVAILLFFTHVQGFVLFCVLATLLFLLAVRWDLLPEGTLPELRKLVWRGLAVLPAILLLFPWVYRNWINPTIPRGMMGLGSISNMHISMDPLFKRLETFFQNTSSVMGSDNDAIVFIGAGLLTLLALAARREGYGHRMYSRAPELLTLLAIGLYLVLPAHVTGQAVIYHRLAPIVVLLFVAWPGGDPFPRRWTKAALLIVPAVALNVSYALAIGKAYENYRGQIAGFKEVISAAKPQTRMTKMYSFGTERGCVKFDGPCTESESFLFGIFRQLTAYHMVLNGGVAASLAERTGRIVQLTDKTIGPTFAYSPQWFRNAAIAQHYDYVLSRKPETQQVIASRHWRLVAQRGDWALFGSLRRP